MRTGNVTSLVYKARGCKVALAYEIKPNLKKGDLHPGGKIVVVILAAAAVTINASTA
jgi:hypothetical protein